MLEIGLSGLLLDSPNSGTAVYTRNLVPRLPLVAPELRFRLFTRQAPWEATEVPSRALHTPLTYLRAGGTLRARIDKLAWEAIALPLAAGLYRESLLHSLHFAAPIAAPCPLVVTVHDLIPMVLPAYRQGAGWWYTRLMARTVRRATVILTVSEHSRRDIVRLLGAPPERVRVTYEAADARFTPEGEPDERDRLAARYGLADRYLLYIGGAERRKNIGMLVRAWAGIADAMRRQETRLVVVGRFPAPGPLYDDIPALVRDLRVERDVLLLPEVAEEDKPALYRSAVALCFPSLYEGFGLTPLEAMACGTPVLAANATSLPEVTGNAAWLLPPDDVDAWTAAMREVSSSGDAAKALSDAGPRRASCFSWERTARDTAQVYREVLER